jgi:hypothetical protein
MEEWAFICQDNDGNHYIVVAYHDIIDAASPTMIRQA